MTHTALPWDDVKRMSDQGDSTPPSHSLTIVRKRSVFTTSAAHGLCGAAAMGWQPGMIVAQVLDGDDALSNSDDSDFGDKVGF